MKALKKVFTGFTGIMMAAALMLTASAMTWAGDAAPEQPFGVRFPEINVGITAEQLVLNNMNLLLLDKDQNPVQPVIRESKTSEGSNIASILYAGVLNSGDASDYTYYFIDDHLAAFTIDMDMPDGYTADKIREGLILNYGEPFQLDTAQLSSISETLGDYIHLEEGQDAWSYFQTEDLIGSVIQEGENVSDGHTDANAAKITGTFEESDGHVRFIVFVDPSENRLVSGSIGFDISSLDGAKDLNGEEREKVIQYLKYLEYQMKRQAEDYIAFIKSQRANGVNEDGSR